MGMMPFSEASFRKKQPHHDPQHYQPTSAVDWLLKNAAVKSRENGHKEDATATHPPHVYLVAM
jgi:hypothetical protein